MWNCGVDHATIRAGFAFHKEIPVDPRQLLKLRFSSEKADSQIAMPLLWAVGLLILVGGTYKVASLQLTEGETFLGLLLVAVLSVQMITAGLIVGLIAANRRG